MGRGGAQGSVEGQVGDTVFFGQAGLDVTAAFAFGLGDGAAASLAAGEAVELGIEAAGGEFGLGLDFLAAFPPLPFLRGLGNSLGAGLGLRDIGPFVYVRFRV
jgi:hypothetical protein